LHVRDREGHLSSIFLYLDPFLTYSPLSNRIVKSQDNPSWQHEFFIRGSPELISKISRTRIKGKTVAQATGKPNVPEDSSEGASDFNEDDGSYDYEDGSNVSDNTRRTRISSSDDVPAPFKDESFDEKLNSMFSVRSPSQNSGYESIEQMHLEPLPVECDGILDWHGNRNNSDLAEFGKLLGRL
jgi:hypothetical protein